MCALHESVAPVRVYVRDARAMRTAYGVVAEHEAARAAPQRSPRRAAIRRRRAAAVLEHTPVPAQGAKQGAKQSASGPGALYLPHTTAARWVGCRKVDARCRVNVPVRPSKQSALGLCRCTACVVQSAGCGVPRGFGAGCGAPDVHELVIGGVLDCAAPAARGRTIASRNRGAGGRMCARGIQWQGARVHHADGQGVHGGCWPRPARQAVGVTRRQSNGKQATPAVAHESFVRQRWRHRCVCVRACVCLRLCEELRERRRGDRREGGERRRWQGRRDRRRGTDAQRCRGEGRGRGTAGRGRRGCSMLLCAPPSRCSTSGSA